MSLHGLYTLLQRPAAFHHVSLPPSLGCPNFSWPRSALPPRQSPILLLACTATRVQHAMPARALRPKSDGLPAQLVGMWHTLTQHLGSCHHTAAACLPTALPCAGGARASVALVRVCSTEGNKRMKKKAGQGAWKRGTKRWRKRKKHADRDVGKAAEQEIKRARKGVTTSSWGSSLSVRARSGAMGNREQHDRWGEAMALSMTHEGKWDRVAGTAGWIDSTYRYIGGAARESTWGCHDRMPGGHAGREGGREAGQAPGHMMYSKRSRWEQQVLPGLQLAPKRRF